ncbi:hypothetical protein CFR73_08205 [Novacetimonas maltaceti]|uniref:Glycosyl transferase family 1 domain-containing protein n=1 Tax=Novacetimonas maltaceti TaxID=1203393 RepID=A0A2S3W1I4_9PROT|nr:glycosyltransferase family 1 protein [Novacetimonas maltaceti]POF62706.1 hypothetical protein KMAL_16430 [Novacetimonas maltaceti]PYD60146.1 hypothetical protein CFR73_08205 [Novacetimonas maltaceti]
MPQNTLPTVWLEISDFMEYARGGNITVSGIQRVTANLVTLRGESKYNVMPVIAEDDDTVLYAVDIELFQKLVDGLQSGLHDSKYIQKLEKKVRENLVPARTSAGDIFVIAGAFWIYQDFQFLKNLRERGLKIGVLVYDLIAIRKPYFVIPILTRIFEDALLDVLSEVTLVLTISDHVRDDLKDYIQTRLGLDIPVESVTMPTELPEVSYTYENIRSEVKAVAKQDYVLFVSTIEMRKNHALLVNVWERLRQDRNLNVPNLVFVGKWGWEVEDLKNDINRSGGSGKWLFILNNMSDEELNYLYRNCLLTAYPSFAEGWGLPVGESLAHGKMCIASNATSIPEVGGDLVDYIDPYNVDRACETFRSFFRDHDRIRQREKDIRENFRVKTWDAYCKEFYKNIDQHIEDKNALSREGNYVYSPGEIYFYGSDDVSEQNEKGGLLVTARMTRVSGWNRLEKWGCWAANNRAVIDLPTSLPAGRKVRVFIRVKAPVSQERMWLSCQAGGEDFAYGNVSPVAAFINFDGVIGQDGNLRVVLNSTGVPAPDSSYPTVHVGISAIGFVPADDAAACLGFLEKILNETPKTLGDAIGTMPRGQANATGPGMGSPFLSRLLLGKAENPNPILGTVEKMSDRLSLFRARRSARKQKWGEAEKYYAAMLRRYINRPRILVQYGHMLKEQGFYAPAAEAYRQAAKIDPSDKEIRKHLAAVEHMVNS